MNLRLVAKVLGLLVALTGATMITALPWALIDGTPDRAPLALSAVVTMAAGLLIWLAFRRDRSEVHRREAMAIVTLGWLFAAAFGALPFVLTPSAGLSYVDAFFESMSGFTTTGASVLEDVEVWPRGLLWWRSFTHWLGGMGIIVLFIAVLPVFGVGGRQLFRSEVPGPTPEGLRPRVAQTARLLWAIYAGLSLAEVVLLRITGVQFFDAACHTFGTMATGGFSTRNHSVAGLGNPAAEWVIIVFMLLAGANFALYWRALNGDLWAMVRDVELRTYLILLGGAAVVLGLLVNGAGLIEGFAETARTAIFQSLTMMTTTGFSNANFATWPTAACLLLVMLMFVGGCAGSTGGGMKVVRIFLVSRSALIDARRTFRPRDVFTLKLGGRVVSNEVRSAVVSFVSLFIGIWALGAFTLALIDDFDLITAASASIAAIGNIGPGLGAVGPEQNYAWVSPPAKLLLTFLMLMGRLELFTVLTLFSRHLWRR